MKRQEYEIKLNELVDHVYELKIYTIDTNDKIYPISWVDIPYSNEYEFMVDLYRKKHYPGMKKYFKKL